jgi:nucleotide-binding universal stress UspA family protein
VDRSTKTTAAEETTMTTNRAPNERIIRRVLHPTDLDPGSRAALALAASLAQGWNADLHVLHVATPRPGEKPGDPPLADCVRGAESLRDFLPAHPGLRVVATTQPGRVPSTTILAYAAQSDVDLIVMGARRLHRGFGRLLGSVAREVCAGSERPVLTVHDDLATAPRLSRILVPIDFSPAAEEALDAATQIARSTKAEIFLLHVLAEPSPSSRARQLSIWRSRLRARAAAQLQAIAMSLGPGVRVTTEVRIGSPVDEIVRCAADLAADLVVVQSHATPGRLMVGGSVAEEVQRFASVSVLLVKPSVAHELPTAG